MIASHLEIVIWVLDVVERQAELTRVFVVLLAEAFDCEVAGDDFVCLGFAVEELEVKLGGLKGGYAFVELLEDLGGVAESAVYEGHLVYQVQLHCFLEQLQLFFDHPQPQLKRTNRLLHILSIACRICFHMCPECTGQELNISALDIVSKGKQQYDSYRQVLHQLLAPFLLYFWYCLPSLDELITLIAV